MVASVSIGVTCASSGLDEGHVWSRRGLETLRIVMEIWEIRYEGSEISTIHQRMEDEGLEKGYKNRVQ
jgi:hypothetical protein